MAFLIELDPPTTASLAWMRKRSPRPSAASRFGNAIRALKPCFHEPKKEPTYRLSAETLAELDDPASPIKSWHRPRRFSSDSVSTCSGVTSSLSSLPGMIDIEEEHGKRSSCPSDPESKDRSPSQPSPSQSAASTPSAALSPAVAQIVLKLCEKAELKYSGAVYQDVRNAFVSVDRDGDGMLSLSEVQNVFQHFGLPPDMAQSLVELSDQHRSEMFHWRDFMAKFAHLFIRQSTWKFNPGEVRRQPSIQ